jgi:hypothetical protein
MSFSSSNSALGRKNLPNSELVFKTFENLWLNAENLQSFWDQLINLIEKWKFITIFEKKYFFIVSLMLKAKIAGVSADRIEVRISKTFVINFQKNEFTLKSC